MMQLATIASFVVLLCGFFGTTAANDDQNTITGHVARSINGVSDLCIFGKKSVSMVLFTSDIPNGTYVQVNESCNLLDPSKPVFFMTHGFVANAFNYYFSEFASLLLENGYTVFSFDWSNASCYNDLAPVNLLEYPGALYNTHEVYEYLECYIQKVIDDCNVPLKRITLMGHSLGAHISGFAAKKLKKDWNYTIPLLIGTDPAAPGFTLAPCGDRFCVDDAERVVALHTSALGIQKSLADLDLWFNDGVCQPACGAALVCDLNVNCSHNIAIRYLANTLDDCVYTGVYIPRRECLVSSILPGCSSDGSNCQVVDKRIFDSNYSITGNYRVPVSSMDPYCIEDDSNCQK